MKKVYLAALIGFLSIQMQSVCQSLSRLSEEITEKTRSAPTIKDLIHTEFSSSDNQFSNHVFRRFYFVNRLAKTMQLFAVLDKQLSRKKIMLNENTLFNFDALSFRHETIKKSINAMQQSYSMKPLFVIWNDFTRYRSIEDQLLVEEFTKEIFVISRNLIMSSYTIVFEDQQKYGFDFSRNIVLSPCALLDLIDTYISFFLQYNPFSEAMLSTHHKQKEAERAVDLKPFVHIDEIMERFYHVQRLHRIIEVLAKADRCAVPLKIFYNVQSMSVVVENRLTFSNPEIISCIKVMHQTSTLKSLLKLWEGFEQYKHIQDHQFVREFSILVYFTCKELIVQTANTPEKNFDIYATLEMLPLEEILYAIDILAKELPPLLEKFELKSDISWKEWLRKYWWAPPVVAIALACKVLLAIKIAQIFRTKHA